MLTATPLAMATLKTVIAERQRQGGLDFVSPTASRDPHTDVANRKIWMRGITFRVDRSARTACRERGKKPVTRGLRVTKNLPPTFPSHSGGHA